MEPKEFDRLIKSRIQQPSDVYQKEMEAAKPFVWSAVQGNLRNTGQVRHWQLAAAAAVLLILFSLILYTSKQEHQKELDLVYGKMDQLQQHFNTQTNLLQTREMQLDSVASQLNQVALHLEQLTQRPIASSTTSPILKVDTVFIRQIEYVTAKPDPDIPEASDPENSTLPSSAVVQVSPPQENKIDHVIYPSQKSAVHNSKDAIKVKFGSFTARKD